MAATVVVDITDGRKRVHGAVAARLIERDSVSLKLQFSTTTRLLPSHCFECEATSEVT
jgi:hypothetical protein